MTDAQIEQISPEIRVHFTLTELNRLMFVKWLIEQGRLTEFPFQF